MIRQYFAHRRRGGDNPLGVGVIAVGSIYYLQESAFFRDRFGGPATCRTPWLVEAFLNGQCHAARRDPDTGRWASVFMSRRSDMAVVRSLRDGRRQEVAVRTLELHDDLGLWKEPTAYPSLPDLRFHRRSAATSSPRRTFHAQHAPRRGQAPRPDPSAGEPAMLTPAIERQRCLNSAGAWRRQAGHVREHAQCRHLQPGQRDMLLREAEACDRQADWWLAGAEDYVPDAAGAGPEEPRP